MEAEIREAGPEDMPRLDAALRALADDLGDAYHGSPEGLSAACTGRAPFAGALLAERAEEALGALLFTPVYSTTQGGAGLRVSDLWVARQARGSGLGRRLLSAVARLGAARWGAGFLMIPVYAENDRARAFYARLGCDFVERDVTAVLGPRAFAGLMEKST